MANAVVAYRAQHRLSQTALARQIGLPRPARARLEPGEHNPSLDTLERLSTAPGVWFAGVTREEAQRQFSEYHSRQVDEP